MKALIDRPFWLTLYTFHHVCDRLERQSLERRRERVDAGFLTAYAQHKPERLQDELRAVRDAIEGQSRGAAVQPDVQTTRARGLAMAARIESTGGFPKLLRSGETS
jgi:hypothetical protein